MIAWLGQGFQPTGLTTLAAGVWMEESIEEFINERVWMQPGSESEAAIRFCHGHGIRVVHNVCAMIRKRQWN